MSEQALSPTRPYLLRALYEWCADNSLTPYVAAYVDDSVRVPQEFVKNNEIVLNISMDATSNLQIDNDFLQFKARFGGIAREIVVPITHVIAIYARENGQGMAFPSPANALQPVGQPEGTGGVPVPPSMRPGALRSVSPVRSVGQSMDGDKVVSLRKPQEAKNPKPVSNITSKPSLVIASKDESEDAPPPTPSTPPEGSPKRASLTRIK